MRAVFLLAVFGVGLACVAHRSSTAVVRSGCTVRGLVRDEVGPVQHAHLTVERAATSEHIETDERGRFELKLAPGVWDVEAVSEHHVIRDSRDVITIVAVDGSTIDDVQFVLRAKHVVRGRVERTSGPVSGAEVSDEHYGTTTTSSDGTFELEAWPANAPLHVSHPCCYVARDVQPDGGFRRIVLHELEGTPATVTGRVVDEQGARVPSATVVIGAFDLVERNVRRAPEAFIDAGADGQFVAAVRGAWADAWAFNETHFSMPQRFAVGGEPLELVVRSLGKPTSKVSGTVTANGEPLERFSIDGRAFRSPNGSYEVPFSGEQTFVVTSGEFAAATKTVRAEPGMTRHRVDFNLQAGSAIEGSVVDELSRRPLHDARVRTRLGPQETRTNLDGGFRLVGLSVGPASLIISHEGHLTRHVELNAPTTVSLTLHGKSEDEGSSDYDGIGLVFDESLREDGYAIRELHPTGGAITAGLRVGDIVTACETLKANAVDFEHFNDTIRGPAGTTVKLTVLRDGRVFDVRVERRRLQW